jgi:integration host factor subunit alpha
VKEIMKKNTNTLTKEKACDHLQKKLGFSAKEAREYLETLLEQIKNELEQGNFVKISGFGKWSVRSKTSRPGRNPHTGGKIKISARNVITFHPSDKLRTLINEAK